MLPLDVFLVDLALATVALGLVSLVRPLRFLGIRTRLVAALVAGAGVAVFLLGLSLPVSPPHLPGPKMAIDEVMPAYQFGEHHEIRVAAPPERVLQAAREVTAREIRLFRFLTWLRSPRLPGSGRESIMNASCCCASSRGARSSSAPWSAATGDSRRARRRSSRRSRARWRTPR
jgi:hypothetical protein